MSLRVFLSHSHKDSDWCNVFVEELQAHGLDVWYDRQGLHAGAQWVKTLEQELQGRDIYLVVLTPDAWASHWVQNELSLALGQRKQIIGVLYKPTPVTGFLTNYQLLDVTRLGARQAAQEVAATLQVTKPASPQLLVSRQPPPSSLTRPSFSQRLVSRQPPPNAVGTPPIDVSGEWEQYSWKLPEIGEGPRLHLDLRQEGTQITGTGWWSSSDYTVAGSITDGHLLLEVTDATTQSLDYRLDLTVGAQDPKKFSGNLIYLRRESRDRDPVHFILVRRGHDLYLSSPSRQRRR